MQKRHRPVALIILDGWGYREEKEANAIAAAKKPHWDYLWKHYPHTLISGSGKCVGLPAGQMGNSEVGHLTIGAGRVIHQDLTRIDSSIEDLSFFKNPALLKAMQEAKKSDRPVHILGLLSDGGVHSHERHLHAIVKLASELQIQKLYFHVFLDGRDTPPKSAALYLEKLIQQCEKFQCGKIVSMIGRYYAMDRDKRWERIQVAYDLLTKGQAECYASDPLNALQSAYDRGETDEFVKPTSIHDAELHPITIEDGDSVIFMNFRADRAREISQTFIENAKTHFVTLMEYDATFPVSIAYPPVPLTNILPDYISQLGLTQLRIAETEKYAHVTFFFNGGQETPFPGEDRVLIPSPKVATYDLQPEMSAPEVTDRLVEEIKNQKYDMIICNFANPDMVGHTGNFQATVKAIETIDTCLGKITEALQSVGGEALITADHGNAEQMFDEKTQQPHTAHTSELIPLIYVGRKANVIKQNGILSDIAPTILYLLELSQPKDMTGKNLFELT